MKLFILASLVVSLEASTLVEKAKENGLKSIPSNQAALMKLIDNPKNPLTEEKITLGKKLFFDPRLSKSGFISCNSCHNLATGGVDGLEAAVGHKWTINPHHLNSPTVYNAVFMDSQFWDGRDPDLEKQAQGPIQAGPEMAATKEHVLKTVASIPDYMRALRKIYGKAPISFEKITDTIAAFERTLVTPSSYDAFLDGDNSALTAKQQKGLDLFIDKGCVSCHSGIALGGGMQTFNHTDYKYNTFGDFKGDANGMVKVPTLRNIAQTAPYFHNGKIWSLEEAVSEMARIQLGMTLSKSENASIVSFLKSLSGTKPTVTYPQLPASTAKTPHPNLD